jgi:Fe-S-cluster containining protein
MTKRYNCAKCPGYCCSYPRIEIDAEDLARLAAHFNLSEKKAGKRFSKPIKAKASDRAGGPVAILRHQEDEFFGSICIFFDTKKRRCGAYGARPGICREYPGRNTCGYYEFLKFERSAQQDQDYIALTGN